ASQPFPAGSHTGGSARPPAIPAGRGDLPGRGEPGGRSGAEFTGRITADGSSGFPAEPGRYQLYASLACPWSHRALIVRRLLGLEQVIGLSLVDPIRDERGWRFPAA